LHQLAGAGSISGPGIINVERPQESPTDEIRQFLQNVDPMRLEQEVLSRFGGLDDDPTMAVAIKVLLEWANDASN